MAGGKGGSTTSTVEVPEYIEEAARRNLAKAEGISQIGFTPYYGPDVAAFTPFQQAGFQQTADVAGAFGMATPTSQRDIMGGMGAPTQYANGVMGYSSAPLYEQSLAELERRRPAQKAYIDSFFIDPVTGQAGSRVQPAIDYSQYMTGAEERERGRQNQLDVARAESGQYTGPMTMSPNGSQPELDAAMQFHASRMGRGSDNWQTVDEMNFQQGKINAAGFPIDAQGNVISAGSFGEVAGDIGNFLTGGGFVGAAGRELGILPSTMDPDGRAGSAPPVRPFIAAPAVLPMDGSPYVIPAGGGTKLYDGPRPSARPSDDIVGKDPATGSNVYKMKKNDDGTYSSSGGKDEAGGSAGGGGEDKILCCAYYNLGYLPREIWRLDQRYGVWLHRNDPELMEGYHAWAAPLAEYIQKDTCGAKAARAVMWPIVKAWAAEMAHKQRPEKHKSNVVGKMIMAIGEPFSRVCGMLKPREIRGEA